MIKTKAVRVCDFCGKEVDEKERVYTEDVPNEGCSSIRYKKKEVPIDEMDFCTFACFAEYVRRGLGFKEREES